MRNDPKSKGERSEGAVLAALLQMGFPVLMPFGDNQRYDLVVDAHGRFIRVQCKTGCIRGGAIAFRTSSSYAHRGRGRRQYHGEADVFAVYCADLNKVFFVKVADTGSSMVRLRVDASKNGQKHGVRSAADYEAWPF